MWGSNQGYWMELEEIILIVNLSKKLTFQASSPEIRAKFRNILALEKGKRTHKKTRLVWSYHANVCVPVHCCHHFLPLVTWTPSSQCKLNLAQQQQLNRKIPTSFKKTKNKLKERDPISTHSEGKPLAWAPLVGTDSSTLARAVADASITPSVFGTRAPKPGAMIPMSSTALRMAINIQKKKVSFSNSSTTQCLSSMRGRMETVPPPYCL